MDDNYNFELLPEFSHYISSRDKTRVAPSILIKNSKNVYKKRSGNIANRPGLKARGALNAAQAGVVSSFEWETSFKITRPIRVTSDGTLSVEYDANDGLGPLWYNLLTNLTLTRFIFDGTYTDPDQGKRILLAANGSIRQIYNWEGGIAQVASATPLVSGVIRQGFNIGFAIQSGGSGYTVNDTLTLLGGDGTAQVFVSAVNGSGVITALAIFLVPQGSGYLTGTAQTAGGTGTGATINIIHTDLGGTLTKKDLSTTFTQVGFSKAHDTSNWKFIYNGVTYTYGGGLDSETLTGIQPDPSGIPPGATIMSSFIAVPNLPYPAAILEFAIYQEFTIDILKVIGNQLFIASYSFNIVFVANVQNYKDFTPTSGGVLGTPFGAYFDDNIVGIASRNINGSPNIVPYIFGGTSSIYQINITTQIFPQATPVATAPIQVVGFTKADLGENAAPVSQEFIDSDGAYFVWLDQGNQLRLYGAVNSIFLADKAPLLSQPVYDELVDVDFGGGALRVIGEFCYITAPKSGIHYIYQTREFLDESGGSRSEKVWNSPQVAGISRFVNIEGVVFGHSNLNPMIYQVWNTGQWYDDSATGDQIAYQCVLAMAYQHLIEKGGRERRQGKARFDKVYFEGYIDRGTPLYGKILYDYQGSTDIKTVQINTVAQPAHLFTYIDSPSLGQDNLGDNPLGIGLPESPDQQEYLPKFKVIKKVKMDKNCSEWAVEIWSYDIGARWEIITFGFNAELSPTGSPKDLLA